MATTLAGCDFEGRLPGMPPEKVEYEEPISFDIEPDLTYEIPSETPHIAVDDTGYLTGQEKIAIMENCEPGDLFYVMDLDGQERVYAGGLESSQSGMVYGDFTELDQEGKYYLWNEKVGYSYPFEIGEDVYRELRDEALIDAKINEDDTEDACYDVLCILVGVETGIAGEGEDTTLLDRTREYLEKLTDRTEGTPYMAAALAGAGAIYRSKDAAFSDACLNAARAMETSYVAEHPEDRAGRFLMSAAFYKAIGLLKDKNAAEMYLRTEAEPDFSDPSVYFGCFFYLMTKGKVDTGICERLMRIFIDEASALEQSDRRTPYMAGETNKDEREILRSGLRIAFVNYAITNHEYRTALQNYVHYFLGRNSEKTRCIPEKYPVEWYLLLMACTQEEAVAITEN